MDDNEGLSIMFGLLGFAAILFVIPAGLAMSTCAERTGYDPNRLDQIEQRLEALEAPAEEPPDTE